MRTGYIGNIDTVPEAIEAGFTMFYALEMLLKLTVFGWARYFSSGR